MSDHDLKRYVVTFRYQERGLGDLQALNSAMVNGGYSTTLHDADGHPHELGTNSFGIVSALEEQALAAVALDQQPDADVTTLEAFLKAQA
ncbi:endoribonuclease GhoS [Pantoea dispersa]|uniref:type V toxin-antitoxin system endoribonuclease antitoxin GhoS n=1 Tax=Pantoea dispersa TaxID=59814 RepID=UPI000F68A7BD|nr:type V toxin-antitoxin system endoribonuclease antitoxin GhoS [Pantoea dispersa]RRW70414.1 endoribonuclease GhoS [Pantoea dispersa]